MHPRLQEQARPASGRSHFNVTCTSDRGGCLPHPSASPPDELLREEIAVITPYRKQVQKLRTALRMLKLSDAIKVGTVEEFQGQERSVILISTVRSHLGIHVDPENKSTIGFLSNPKRFNVAVTRAKLLLIVIGDPAMLKQECWLELLRHAKEKAAYKGVEWADREPEGDEDSSEEGDGEEESKEQSDSTDDDAAEYDFAEAAEENPLERKG